MMKASRKQVTVELSEVDLPVQWFGVFCRNGEAGEEFAVALFRNEVDAEKWAFARHAWAVTRQDGSHLQYKYTVDQVAF